MRVNLANTDGIHEVAPNTFRHISAGYPIQYNGLTYLVLWVKHHALISNSVGSDDKCITTIYLHKLTTSGAYSNSKNAVIKAQMRISGYLEPEHETILDIRNKRWSVIEQYNHIVRSGRNTDYIRHWKFENSSIEDGIKAHISCEAYATWDGWFKSFDTHSVTKFRLLEAVCDTLI